MLNFSGWKLNYGKCLQLMQQLRRFLILLLADLGLRIFGWGCDLAERWQLEDCLWVELPEDWNGSPPGE
jgi:hypothetical protein